MTDRVLVVRRPGSRHRPPRLDHVRRAGVLILVVAGGAHARAAPKRTSGRWRPRPSEAAVPVGGGRSTRRWRAAGDELVAAGARSRPFVESPIYARTTGYLQKWYHDIGSRVKQGDAAGRHRHAGDRPGAAAGARARRDQTAASLALAEVDGRALGRPAQDRLGVAAGSRREAERVYDQLQATPGRRRRERAPAREPRGVQARAPRRSRASSPRAPSTWARSSAPARSSRCSASCRPIPIRVYVSVPEADAAAHARRRSAPARRARSSRARRFEGAVVRTAGVDRPGHADAADRSERARTAAAGCCRAGTRKCTCTSAATSARLQVPVNALLFRAEGARAAVVDDGEPRAPAARSRLGEISAPRVEILHGLTADGLDRRSIPPDSLDDGQNVTRASGRRPAPRRRPGEGAPVSIGARAATALVGRLLAIAAACAPRGPAYQRPAMPLPAPWSAPAPFRAGRAPGRDSQGRLVDALRRRRAERARGRGDDRQPDHEDRGGAGRAGARADGRRRAAIYPQRHGGRAGR